MTNFRAAYAAPLRLGLIALWLPSFAPASETELGRLLFHESRLSGDATTSCAYCHNPETGFSDGLPLAEGYPSTLNFRNSPSLFNTADKKFLYWDGRFPGSDLSSVVRDHLAEPNLMNADGRLITERLRQIPEYAKRFRDVYGSPPSYGNILAAVSAYVRAIRSAKAPFDLYSEGQTDAISPSAKKGWGIFSGDAGCIRCHGGPLFSDGGFHNRRVPENPDVVANPRRQITFRKFFKSSGIDGYRKLKTDPGLYAVSKDIKDKGKFATPSLREIAKTAPYMHNGVFETLEDVVAFEGPGLTDEETADVVAFLNSLSSDVWEPPNSDVPTYSARASLGKDWEAPPLRVRPSIPETFPEIGPLPDPPQPQDNPATPEKLALGRMLFFDTRISGNRENSCSTCHNPEVGWGDGYDISQGYLGTQHWRNSQTLFNVGQYAKLNWDGSKTSLEDQAEAAITSNISANGDPMLIEERLAQAPVYFELFTKVFGKERPLFEDFVRAIAAFVRNTPRSTNVPFDAYALGDKSALSGSAERGLSLFKGKAGCIRCHNGPLFSDEDYHVTAVPENPIFQKDHLKQITLRYQLAANGVSESFYSRVRRDPGLYLVTKQDEDLGKFRTASLRELKYTKPYMHNGVFYSLHEVVDFYDKGGGNAPNKSPLLEKLRLSTQEKKDLVAFLESLSGDQVIVKAPELPGYPGSDHK